MERLTEEKQIGAFASLKDKSETIPGAFASYDCLMAHMTAVTKLKAYEDAEEQGRLVVLCPKSCNGCGVGWGIVASDGKSDICYNHPCSIRAQAEAALRKEQA